jgi:hypothetical protein
MYEKYLKPNPPEVAQAYARLIGELSKLGIPRGNVAVAGDETGYRVQVRSSLSADVYVSIWHPHWNAEGRDQWVVQSEINGDPLVYLSIAYERRNDLHLLAKSAVDVLLAAERDDRADTGLVFVAPCGDEFTTGSDAASHRATCGACAGAEEEQGIYAPDNIG